MQRTECISKEQLDNLIRLIFQIGDVQIFESYSDYEKELLEIADYKDYLNYYQKAIKIGKSHLAFGIYFKESNGFWRIRKISLDPKKCDGNTYRYTIEGWGMTYIHLTLKDSEVECRISVNSKKRANNWETTNPDLKSPELWDWKVIESNARKLIRQLRKQN